MVAKFTIAGNTTQINFRYRCLDEFRAITTDGDIHTFQQKTILRIDEIEEDFVILTYMSFPDRRKIRLKVTPDFEHIEKFEGFST